MQDSKQNIRDSINKKMQVQNRSSRIVDLNILKVTNKTQLRKSWFSRKEMTSVNLFGRLNWNRALLNIRVLNSASDVRRPWFFLTRRNRRIKKHSPKRHVSWHLTFLISDTPGVEEWISRPRKFHEITHFRNCLLISLRNAQISVQMRYGYLYAIS